MTNHLLELSNISKYFPGVKAVDGVNLSLNRGEILALIGENGAGKSTLMKILSGVYRDYQGSILINGDVVAFNNPREAREAGIAIIYQELSVIQELTIAENIFLGREPKKLGMIDFPKMNREAQQILNRIGLKYETDYPLSKLKVGEQQLVEIAKALSLQAKILILDEPTSALTEWETDNLIKIILQLKNQGTAMIYITHHLQEVFKVADKVTVLRDGRTVSQYQTKEKVTRRGLITDMVGREIDENTRRKAKKTGEEVLKVKNLCVAHPFLPGERKVNQVNFTLSQGEILGISGLMGSGRTEILEAIFGASPNDTSGEIYLNQKRVQIKCPRTAIEQGIALVTEDRKRLGLVLDMEIKENLSLAALPALSPWGIILSEKEKKQAKYYIQRLKIKSTGISQQVNTLSGGNQQKVVIGKWLMAQPKVLLLDEPTRGVDVGAKAEIYDLIDDLAKQGISIILVSSDLPEIVALSHRVLVMSEGNLVGELSNEAINEENIMHLASSYTEEEIMV
jgi:D-xylose transport system ATP-binding protein